MRPTKLVANSKESFLDAARQLINKAIALSENVKGIRIIEDIPTIPSKGNDFRLKAHVLKRS